MSNINRLIMPDQKEDQQIAQGILADPDTFEPTDEQLKMLRPIGRPKSANPKQATSIRLSPKVIEYFKRGGSGWQTRLNKVLEEYVESHY